MSALNSQKDLITNFKREVLLNTSILSKVYPIPHDLSRQIFKEEALEKPTQHIFINLSHYLVCVIDPIKSKLITWPLFDTRAEKNYRNELSRFVADYHQQGLLTPVMSSYFVNPGCFRVVKLLFQLSHLAVQRTLKGHIAQGSHVSLYEEMTKQYKVSKKGDFYVTIDKHTNLVSSRFSKYMQKKKLIEEIISVFHKKIAENEAKLAAVRKQRLVEDLVNDFLKTTKMSQENQNQILEIKLIHKETSIFDNWLEETDKSIAKLENGWNDNFTSFVKQSQSCHHTSQTLISRQTGDADKKQYSIEYNHKIDEIPTTSLEALVNVEQKYILKNLVNKEKLNFPNLIRAYLISISHILNSVDFTDDINEFNLGVECEARNFEQVSLALKALIERIENAEGRLLPRQLPYFNASIHIKQFTDIPPLPDLSDLKTARDTLPFQSAFESFTPLTVSKHQFNLRKRQTNSKSMFLAPPPRLFVTPYQAPRADFFKTIQSCKMGAIDKTNNTQNISLMSEAAKRMNETIADCNQGFTKQQIQRLLSTKKGSTTKKSKFNSARPNIHVKKGGLFNDTTTDASMIRSFSSPDLYENKKYKRQKLLSVMQEDIPALLEVSGISIIRNNSEYNTPKNDVITDNSPRNHFDVPNIAMLKISPVQYLDNLGNNLLKTVDLDNNITEINELNLSTNKIELSKINKTEQKPFQEEAKTPVTVPRPPRKSNSIEKIINRFRKVKASVRNDTNHDISNCSTINEEKENLNTVNLNLFQSTKKAILPDLLSPNYGDLKSLKQSNILDDFCFEMEESEHTSRRPRQSLGTALGVDQTILDQFELID